MNGRRLGVWFIGALGSISTTAIVGAMCIRKGFSAGTGMLTESLDFKDMDLLPVGAMIFGGCDIRSGSVRETAYHICNETGTIHRETLAELESELGEIDGRIVHGTARNCGEAIQSLASGYCANGRSIIEEIDILRENLRQFRSNHSLDEIIVINLASTEPSLELQSCHQDLDAFCSSIVERNQGAIRASTLYAYAAIEEGCPYINFTPSNAALLPAIVQLAEMRHVPVMGNDGKTGETLVKSALAPLFPCRNLEVLSWHGVNILGNMDGKILDNPENKKSKISTKDKVLSKVLGYSPHSRVRIDYVPSLDDQKTAWDFIHFRGFLGAKMSLQFIWQGYDSILAAPIVLDLVRLAEFAKRRGESGLMPHLACYFKDPLGVDEHRLYEQYRMLLGYAQTEGKHETVL